MSKLLHRRRDHVRLRRSEMAAAVAAGVVVALVGGFLGAVPVRGTEHAATGLAGQLRSLGGAQLAVFGGGGGGTTWIGDNIPSGLDELTGVACPGATERVAVGQTSGGAGVVIETTDAGETWTEPSLPSGVPPLNAVSCSASANCVAVGGGVYNSGQHSSIVGVILHQSTVGGAFTSETVPSGASDLTSASCPAGSTTCVASAYDFSSGYWDEVVVSTDGGESWSGPDVLTVTQDSDIDYTSTDCFADGTCVLAGNSANGPVFAWTSNFFTSYGSGEFGSTADLTQVSCPVESSCLAEGLTGSFTGSATGGSWSEGSTPSGDQALGDLCLTSTTCAVVGDTGTGSTVTDQPGAIWTTSNGGSNWSSESLPSNAGNIDAIACSSTGLCMAVGEDTSGNGLALLDGGDELTVPPGGPPSSNYRFGGPNPAAPGLCTCASGEPVDPENGDFYTSATDVSLPTFGPLLAFVRTYDAFAAQSATAPGSMGYGWTDNWASALELNTPSTNDVTVAQADGAQVVFVPPQGGACPAPYVGPGTAGTYCALPYVLASLTYNSGSSTYSFVTHPLSTDTFNSAGQLTKITDSESESENVAYPAGGQGGCPSSAYSCEVVTSASGRTLSVELTETQPSGSSLYPLYQVTSVVDPMGRSVSYAYCTPTSSGEGTSCLPGDLLSVTDPMGRVTSFTYDSGNSNAALRHDLVTLTRPNGQPGGPDGGAKLSNTYDTSGRVTSQGDPAGRTTSFDYSGMNETTGTGTVKVTDPDGFVTADNFTNGALTSSVTDSGGTAPAATDFVRNSATLLPTATINADGDGTVTTYDGNGNVASSTNPLGNDSTAAVNPADQTACSSTPLATYPADSCSTLQGAGDLPAPQTAGGTITPAPSSGSGVPPPHVTYDDYDSNGNLLYHTTGVYSGSTLLSVRSTYDLYSGDSITLDGQLISCNATPPAADLPCATIAAPNSASTTVAPPVTQLAYDSYGDVTSRTLIDANGSQNAETSYTYDADGEVTSQTSPLGNLSGADGALYTTTTAYDQDGEVTATTTGLPGSVLGSVTTATHDANGNATAKTNALFEATTTTYDADDEAVLVTDPLGDKTLTCHDGDGHVVQTVPPVGVAGGSLSASSCPTTSPWGFGSPLASDATQTSYSYGSGGLVVTTDSPAPNGHSGVETTTQYYDLAGQLVETASPPIGVPSGEATLSIDTYDAAGELTSETSGLEINTSTGAVGTLSATTTTSYCYDQQGELTASVPGDGNTATSVSSTGVVTGFVCGRGGPTSSDYATTYGYDSAGDVLTTTRPVTSTTTATTTDTYYPGGALETSETPAGMTTTDAYTPAGQIASESYSDSEPEVQIAYDVAGERTSMADAASVSGSQSSYSYNSAGKLASVTNEAGATTAYGYDAAGDVTAISYPLPSASWVTNDTVEYGFDQAQRLSSLTDFAGNTTAITNSADGLPTNVALPTSTAAFVKTVYDNTDAPCVISLVPAGVSPTTCSAGVPSGSLLGFAYTDKPNGAVDTETDTPSQTYEPGSYSYNAADRVTSLTPGTATVQDYSFDASGNLTTLPYNTEAVYKVGSELCWSAPGNPSGGCGTPPSGATLYSYSTDDNLTGESGGATVTATFNHKDQLTSYSDSAANMTSATYDGDGLRAADTIGTTSQNFVWTEATGSVPLMLLDGANAYIYGLGAAPLEQVSLASGTPTYLVADALGSVRGVVSASGGLTASTTYDAWGNPETTGGLTSYTPFGFANGYTDPTGVIYLVHRYYDPLTGQFLSIDPLVSRTNQPYAYAAGDPVDRTDPTGAGGCVGFVVPIACWGNSAPPCWDVLGINRYCPIPVAGPLTAEGCYNEVLWGGYGTTGGCPAGEGKIANELINYDNSLSGPPTTGTVLFEFDIVAQIEGCWTDTSAPLTDCAGSWFPYTSTSNPFSVGNLILNFQISADTNILFIGYAIRGSSQDFRLTLAEDLDHIFTLGEPLAELLGASSC